VEKERSRCLLQHKVRRNSWQRIICSKTTENKVVPKKETEKFSGYKRFLSH
jgi:hypothetical protein